MEKTSRLKTYARVIAIALGMVLWLISWYIANFDYNVTRYVQVVILKIPYTVETVETNAVLITALVYSVIAFLSVLITFSGIVSVLFEKPLVESGRKQMCRSFAFFGLLPNVIAGCAWEFMWAYLPVKPYGYVPPVIEIEPMLNFAFVTKGAALHILTCLAYLIAYAYLFGVMPKANTWLNVICGVLWAVYAYEILFNATLHFEYGKWILLFILLCYLILGLAFLVHKLKKEDPLMPKYDVFIVSLDDDDDDFEEDDDKQYDFSIFMPSGKNDETNDSN